MPALAPDGQLLVLGSLIHYDSLLANLSNPKRFARWNYRVYRAIEADPRARRRAIPPRRALARPLADRAAQRRARARIGSLAFEQEYQANPIDTSLRCFQPEWLQRYDEQDLKNRDLVTVMTVDPATGKTSGDFFAIWVGSVDPRSGIIYTRALTRIIHRQAFGWCVRMATCGLALNGGMGCDSARNTPFPPCTARVVGWGLRTGGDGAAAAGDGDIGWPVRPLAGEGDHDAPGRLHDRRRHLDHPAAPSRRLGRSQFGRGQFVVA